MNDLSHPVSQNGKYKLAEYLHAYSELYTALSDSAKTETGDVSVYCDLERWPGDCSLDNRAKYLTNSRLAFPLAFNVEVTTLCPFKCEFCVLHGGRLAAKRTQSFLSYDEFRQLFDQIGFFVTCVEFTGGEPFLNKDLFRMIALLNEHKVKTSVSTNASPLTRDNIQRLLENPPSLLRVAYESGDADAYAAHRLGGKIDRLNANVRDLLEARRLRGQSYPKVYLQTVVSRETVRHVDVFWNNAQEMGVDEAGIKPILAWPDGGGEHFALMKEKYLIPNHPLSYYRADESGELLPTGVDGFCPNVQHVHIGADCSVIPCWYNLLSSPTLGNVLHDNFLDVWFSEQTAAFHAAMSNHTAFEHGCRYCIGIYHGNLFETRRFAGGGGGTATP